MNHRVQQIGRILAEIESRHAPKRLTPSDYAAWLRGDMTPAQLATFRDRERAEAEANAKRGVVRSEPPTQAESEALAWLDALVQTISSKK